MLLAVSTFLILYVIGIRSPGRPLAEFSWRFWVQIPHQPPNFWSWLLHPLAHTCIVPGAQLQELLLPYRLHSRRNPGFMPNIQWYLYGEPQGTSDGYVAGEGPVYVWYRTDLDAQADAKERYIRFASFAWPLRLMILPFCYLLAMVILWFGPVREPRLS